MTPAPRHLPMDRYWLQPADVLPVEIASRLVIMPSGCWEWPAPPNAKPNWRPKRNVWLNGKRETLVYRVGLILHAGPAPADKPLACHKCNNPRCCRPDPEHVYWGSNKDNAADLVATGHSLITNAKLTPDSVRYVRSRKGLASCYVVAKEVGVTWTAVWKVWAGQHWSSVPDEPEAS